MIAMHSRRFCFRRRLLGLEPVRGGERGGLGDLAPGVAVAAGQLDPRPLGRLGGVGAVGVALDEVQDVVDLIFGGLVEQFGVGVEVEEEIIKGQSLYC
jgi:hypothetical protein